MKKYRHLLIITCIILLQAVFCLVTFETFVHGEIGPVGTWMMQHPLYFLYNIAIISILLWLFYMIFHDLRWGFLIWQILFIILGIAESLKLAARKEYIEITDLTIAGEWTQAASDVKFDHYGMVAAVVILTMLVLILLTCFRSKWKTKRTKKNCLLGFASVGAAIVVFMLAVYMPVVHAGIKERVVLGMQGEMKGGVVCLLESIAYQTMTSEYSDAIYDEVLAADGLKESDLVPVEEKTDSIAVKPNVIVIMSEALWDINQISDAVTFSKNPMEFFDELGESAFCGKAASNVFGGGTDKSEFEFLTGWNAKYAVNGSSPYRDYFTHGQASMVQYMNSLGYYTYGIHPYKGSFWGRTTAYTNMGFKAFYDMERMRYQDQYDIFVSDESLVNEIIYRFQEQKQKSDQPVFSFNVSIQNHVTKFFKGTAGPVCREVTPTYLCDSNAISEYNRQKLLDYINGVYTSGKALKQLLDYFESIKDPTVVVVFGDHAPSFLTDFEPFVDEKVSQEAFYETPFYVWNNYGKTGFPTDETNISYLSEALLEYLDFPLSKQALMNRYLRSYCPVDTRFLVKDASKNAQNMRDEDYITRSYGVSNAMHYILPMESNTQTDIWTKVK